MLRNPFSRNTTTPFDDLITEVLDEMSLIGPTSEKYQDLMAYLERLQQLKTYTRSEPLSRNTIALIAGNLMGILLIIAYEQKHVMTSKGFGEVVRPRAPGT